MEPSQQNSAGSSEPSQAGLKFKHSPGNPAVRPLYTVTSIDDFKTIFVDLAKTHRAFYELEGSFDSISHSNMMFTNASQPRAVIVLLDHPLQMPADNAPHIRKRDARIEHPFLPYDHTLFGAESAIGGSLYRHHLESFFYILLYCSLRYTTLPAQPSQPTNVVLISDWFERYHLCGRRTKTNIFRIESYRDAVFTETLHGLGADPEIKLWLRGLWEIFKKVVEKENSWICSKEGPVEWRLATLSGRATFEEFMAVLSGRGRVSVTDKSCAPRCAMFMP